MITKPKSAKKIHPKLSWPRSAEDDANVQLGVDVQAKKTDIVKIVHKFFKVEGYSMEELLQEIYVAIIHKNCTRSAHDPRKSSFGHYVYMVANNVCINLVHKSKRYDRERESLDAPCGFDDGRTLLDTIEIAVDGPDLAMEHMDSLEDEIRARGMFDIARYVRATRTGASSEVIREALSFGDKKVSNKNIRDIRMQLKDFIGSLQASQ